MELLTPRFMKTVGVFTGLHTAVWLLCRYVMENCFVGEQSDLMVALLLITGLPIAMMYCAQITRRITGSPWQESIYALLIAGPVSFTLAWQFFFFAGFEFTIYIAAVNLMGIFLLPLWDTQTRAEYDGALAIPERMVLLAAVLPPVALAAYGLLVGDYPEEVYSMLLWLVATEFFFGTVASLLLGYAKKWRESAMVGAGVTVAFVVGISLIIVIAMTQQ